jgi:hypothetical protein
MPHASSMTLNVSTAQESRAERVGSGQEDGGEQGSAAGHGVRSARGTWVACAAA